jgi:hypothetical protein
MTTFAAPASTLEAKAPDASKHVNYTLGMILGVDDFNQEFAWLSGRDRWLARDAIGYGTLNGLAVSLETPPKGPRINVTSGSALSPRGQLVCVKPSQCAYLNDWLTVHKDDIPPLLGSPISGTISLYLTLCYRDCPDDLVPIPGSPCRTEDQLQAPSRLVDGFSLDFRTAPPNQNEEDLIREFVNWLRTLTFGGGGPYVTVDDFETNLLEAAKTMAVPTMSPAGPIHFPIGSPLAGMVLDPANTKDYDQVAFRIWIEEIRPLVHPLCGGGCGCGCSGSTDAPKADECLLLARIDVPVQLSSGNWIVSDPANVVIDESNRPMLLHLRMLQELVTGSIGGVAPAEAARSSIVAAGAVSFTTQELPIFGQLAVALQAPNTIRVSFAGYQQPTAGSHLYSVTAMARTGPIANPTIQFDSYAADGILLKVTNGAAAVTDANLKATTFNLEVRRVE